MAQGTSNGGAMSVRTLNELLAKAIQETASGKCSVESAKAIASLAAQMNNLLRTDLDAMRLQHDIGGSEPVRLVLGEKIVEPEVTD